jgi:hypothetical protein
MNAATPVPTIGVRRGCFGKREGRSITSIARFSTALGTTTPASKGDVVFMCPRDAAHRLPRRPLIPPEATAAHERRNWIPACAGMTEEDPACAGMTEEDPACAGMTEEPPPARG